MGEIQINSDARYGGKLMFVMRIKSEKMMSDDMWTVGEHHFV